MGLSKYNCACITLLILGVTYIKPVRETTSLVGSPFIGSY